MYAKRRTGFTLIEVLIVVLIMAVLAATVIPQFQTSAAEAEKATAEFNLQTMRSQIALYKSQHSGSAPSAMSLLTKTTDVSGTVGTTATHKFGPYLVELPQGPLHSNAEIEAGDGTAVIGTAAWQYNSATGGLWINHADYISGGS